MIIVGTIIWSLTMVKSGLVYGYGVGFWGPNGHDGVWHIALAESLFRGSRGMPTFAGSALQNYHIGFDLLLAFLSKITGISIDSLYFQLLPPILALLIGLLTHKFTLSWMKSSRTAFWATFFVYFGGSWSWILGKGESAFWSQQAISTLINPPFALSLIFLLLGLIFLVKKEKKFLDYTLCALFFGLLIQIKAYAGILALGGLAVAGIVRLILHHKSDILYLFLGSLILSLILFLPLNKGSSSMLVWQPFWFLETMMGLTDRLGWLKFHSAMTTYRMAGIWWKAIPAYLVAFVIFWYGNMGMRFLSELTIVKWIKEKSFSVIEIFIVFIILAGGLIPMFFLQKGTPWNTIQFFYYSLFFSGILAGIALSRATNYLLLAIILLTIPTTVATLRHYLPSRPPAMLSRGELEALNFLSQQPNGVVLTYPFDRIAAKEAEANPPRPLYLYESTAYVSAYGKKDVFLEDEVNLDIMGYDWKARRAEIEKFYQSLDQEFVRDFLKKNNIKYIYWTAKQRAKLGDAQLGLLKIFENEKVNVWIVKN